MKCLSCDYPDTHVVSSEKNELKNIIKRRRECLRCGVRFTTQENYRDPHGQGPYTTQKAQRK